VIRVHQLVGGERLESVDGTEAAVPPPAGTTIWIRAVEPTDEELAHLREAFSLEELTLQGVRDPGHPPTLVDCGPHLFVFFYTPVEWGRGRFHKLAVFLGPDWVLSIQSVLVSPCEEVEARVLHEPQRYLVAPERVLHALVDQMVEGFAHRVDGLAERAEALEGAVLDGDARDVMRRILDLRRDTSRVTRAVRRQRDLLLSLSRTNHDVLSHRIVPYFRDAYDHCLRVAESLETGKEMLAAIRDAHLAIVNNRLSEIMRVLTVIATIMMPLSLVAGIFGMNFEPMPLLKTAYGFWLSVGVMLAVAGTMLLWFRRRGWL
jgi:magnesium transporter